MILALLAARFGAAQEGNVVFEGATVDYYVVNHPGNTYIWEVFTGFDPDQPAPPGDYTFAGPATGDTVSVQWNTAGIYYLKVTETDTEGCVNVKALAVNVIENIRTIAFLSGTSSACFSSDNGFDIPVELLDQDGQPLTSDIFPVQVGITVNGTPYSQQVAYSNQVVSVENDWLTAGPGANTNITVALTGALDVSGVAIFPVPADSVHTRMIFAQPEIAFTTGDVSITQGLNNVHQVLMNTGLATGAVFSWSVSPAGGTSTDLPAINGNTADITWDGPPGSYVLTVQATDGNGCVSNTATQNITIVEPDELIVSAGNDTTIGSCGPFVLQATVSDPLGLNYLWTPADNLDDPTLLNPVFTPGSSTTFTLTVTDSLGKQVSDTVEIEVSTVIADAGDDLLIGPGETVQLDGSGSFGEALLYLWTTETGNIVSGANTPTPEVDLPGSYFLEVTDAFNCTARDTVVVTESGIVLPVVDAGNDTTIGSCDPYRLQATVSDPTGLSYLWTPAGDLDDATLLNPVFTPGTSTTFVLTATTASGASVSDTVEITVSEILADAGEDVTMEKNSTVMLDGSSSVGEDLQFVWTTTNGTIDSGENTPYPVVSRAGRYYLEVTDKFGCSALDSVEVSLLTYAPVANDDYDTTSFQTPVKIAVLENDYDPDDDLDPESLTITADPINGSAYVDFNDHTIVYTPGTGFVGNDIFEYRICDLTDQCDNANVYVVVTDFTFLVPNAFTPNGDGINDYFEIKGIEYYEGNSIKIINRWGKEVYEARNYGIDTNPRFWDGKSNKGGGNDELPGGTYYYVLDLGNGQKPIAGSVYIDR